MEDTRTMVTVKALVTVMDDGKTHAAGDVFSMEQSMADAHVKAGQVEVAATEKAAKKS